MTRNLTIRRTRLRFVLTTHGAGGMFQPRVQAYLRGPNGSVAGVGPKPWPRALYRLFGTRYGSTHRDPMSLTFALPMLTWAQAYRLRRLGAYHVYRYHHRLYRWLEAR